VHFALCEPLDRGSDDTVDGIYGSYSGLVTASAQGSVIVVGITLKFCSHQLMKSRQEFSDSFASHYVFIPDFVADFCITASLSYLCNQNF
jgi:hypothetical protein